MNIVKRLKTSNWQSWRNRPYQYWNSKIVEFLPTILLGSLIGTYLDLYFVGRGFYAFPTRPVPNIFTVNISFTLIGLPAFIFFLLYLAKRMTVGGRAGLIIFLSLLVPFLEKLAEELGLFVHSSQWKHFYSLIGYFIFMILLLSFYCMTNNGECEK